MVHFKLSTKDSLKIEKLELMSKATYSSVMGSIIYIMVCTRPDMSHVISVVNINIGNLGKVH